MGTSTPRPVGVKVSKQTSLCNSVYLNLSNNVCVCRFRFSRTVQRGTQGAGCPPVFRPSNPVVYRTCHPTGRHVVGRELTLAREMSESSVDVCIEHPHPSLLLSRRELSLILLATLYRNVVKVFPPLRPLW